MTNFDRLVREFGEDEAIRIFNGDVNNLHKWIEDQEERKKENDQ